MTHRAILVLAIACTPHRLDVVECAAACGGSAGVAGAAPGGSSDGGSAGAESADAGAGGLPATILHRYDFEGTGTAVLDRVGDAHGTVIGTELSVSDGRGVVVLAGRRSGQYVELPSGIISVLHNATFEAWVTWNGASVWERIFDFGSQVGEPGQRIGSTYLFLTPRTPGDISGVTRLAQQRLGQPELILDADTTMAADTLTHLAVVVDNDRSVIQLFRDGELVGARGVVGSDGRSFHALNTVQDENSWLGRSLYEQDAYFGGTFHEFRIHGAALSAAAVRASYESGPDPG